MSRFIDEHRGRFGVEPICRTLGVSASAYYYQRATGQRSARAVGDERLLEQIEAVHAATITVTAIAGRGWRSDAPAPTSAATGSSG